MQIWKFYYFFKIVFSINSCNAIFRFYAISFCKNSMFDRSCPLFPVYTKLAFPATEWRKMESCCFKISWSASFNTILGHSRYQSFIFFKPMVSTKTFGFLFLWFYIAWNKTRNGTIYPQNIANFQDLPYFISNSKTFILKVLLAKFLWAVGFSY